MVADLSILKVASAMAQHAAMRHRVLSENMANADTPGFKARDIPAFDPKEALKQARRNAAEGQPFASPVDNLRPFEVETYESSPNGNTVSVQEQMVSATDAQAQHQAALTIYRKSMDLLRLSVTGRIR